MPSTTAHRTTAGTTPGTTHRTRRRTVLAGAAAVGASTTLTAAARERPGRPRPPRPRPDRPNVVVVSIDDLGWDELGCYGNTFHETPEIDRLAREGVLFTQAYAAAPLCSPTRAALVTGRYPGHTGITDFLRNEPAASDTHLSPTIPGVASVLGTRGYTTGLVGKWHLTETYSGAYAQRPGNPFAHGFTEVRASEELYIADGDYVHPYFFMPTLPARIPGEYLTDRLADEAVDFVTAHAERPFFLHVSNYAVHTTLVARPDLLATYEAKPGADEAPNRPVLAAMLESVDQQVGRIRAALEQLGLAERTLLLVTSDNGGQSRPANAPLRGGKGELYEGGIRVPLVAWGPGLVRAGRVEEVPTSTIDLLPTAADLAGTAVPVGPDGRGADGVSIAAALTGRGRPVAREALYWAYPHHIGRTHPHAAVRAGRHKLVLHLRDRRAELYDLARDPGETTDRSAADPATTARLRRLLDAHLAELDLVPGPPDEVSHPVVELDEPFEALPADWTLLPVPAGAAGAIATASDGELRIGSPAPGQLLAVSPVAPGSESIALVVEAGGLPDSGAEETLFAGLVQDAENHLLVRYRHDLRRVGWDLRVGGRLVTVGQEPLTTLDGTVDLARPGSRLAVVGRGRVWAVHVDQGAGWEMLFRFDVGGVLDLADPAARSRYRYAVGARVGSGASVGIAHLLARRA